MGLQELQACPACNGHNWSPPSQTPPSYTQAYLADPPASHFWSPETLSTADATSPSASAAPFDAPDSQTGSVKVVRRGSRSGPKTQVSSSLSSLRSGVCFLFSSLSSLQLLPLSGRSGQAFRTGQQLFVPSPSFQSPLLPLQPLDLLLVPLLPFCSCCCSCCDCCCGSVQAEKDKIRDAMLGRKWTEEHKQ